MGNPVFDFYSAHDEIAEPGFNRLPLHFRENVLPLADSDVEHTPDGWRQTPHYQRLRYELSSFGDRILIRIAAFCMVKFLWTDSEGTGGDDRLLKVSRIADEILAERCGISVAPAMNELTTPRDTDWTIGVKHGLAVVSFYGREPVQNEVGVAYPDAVKRLKAITASIMVKFHRPENILNELGKRSFDMIPMDMVPLFRLGYYVVSQREFERRKLQRVETEEAIKEGRAPRTVNLPKPEGDFAHVDLQDLAEWYAIEFELDPFEIVKIADINHRLTREAPTKKGNRPHLFSIGHHHAQMAQRRAELSGRDPREHVEPTDAPCVVCGFEWREHAFDRVMALRLTRNGLQSDYDRVVNGLRAEFDKDGIVGCILIETDQKFRLENDDDGSDDGSEDGNGTGNDPGSGGKIAGVAGSGEQG